MRFGESYIGFGKESIDGSVTCAKPPVTYPVIGPGQEICEICERVEARRNMHSVGWDIDGAPYYVCTRAHLIEAT